ncbi:hypothetical protein SELMODRAFT_271164 [Selaginella moellendorffii]|uniref:Reticulon-like protein n=1 Tax=Selaginella moellendorffii TaxID=88036 RepID=D8RYM3_SELML|nr:reticulon-like protein B6 [Selaginella moellendorffii]EFJ22749.1 hypothetical protein SELMODRAFT_271164 [Selaginella moellendorffii]|eukprot:XP_002975844.1 reticulon-like protein B6 [Selaginella moellendorffii]
MAPASDDTIQLPASTSADSSSRRLFAREKSVHELLGGGLLGDVLLWRKKHLSASVLGIATLIYVLFEWCGYTVLSVFCNTFLLITIVLFVWSLGASFTNRPPPRIPELQLSEKTVQDVAHTVQLQFNNAVGAFRSIVLERNYVLFLKAAAGLWLLSTVGSWTSLLTLLYIGVIVAHIIPFVYDKYEDKIEHYMKVAVSEGKKQYSKVDEMVVKKIPRAAKEKKSE